MYLLFICTLLLKTPATCAFVQGAWISYDAAMMKLFFQLSSGVAIPCINLPLPKQNAKRYWGERYDKNATLVVITVTKEDASHAVQAASSSKYGRDLAFVCGGHGRINASSSQDFLIDLSWMNSTQILHNIILEDIRISTAIAYQGGAIWKQVTDTTNGTGSTAVGARVGSVGVGGFSTGGGIGSLAGAYGYAIDHLRALEVVLMSAEADNSGYPAPNYTIRQESFNATFSGLLDGVILKNMSTYSVPCGQATELSTLFFPHGHRRGFWGPQTSNVTMPFVDAASKQMELYINQPLSRGESSDSAVWVLQYMYPGQNGHGPASDEATAWPHAQTAHQTLSSPVWESAENDAFVVQHNDALNKITYDHQASIGSFIADYPNYISPKADGHRVWGDNVERLIRVKVKYDPERRIHQGRVSASDTCIERGWANVYPWKS
ncbi:FAD-binding domain-containing protein [Aureobasidium subglaciale]|nr:FAD-binding domain-containing protein [Aureobasidium subglaciale]